MELKVGDRFLHTIYDVPCVVIAITGSTTIRYKLDGIPDGTRTCSPAFV